MMVEYRHELAEAAVKALDDSATDHDIADALADMMLVGKPLPLRLTLNHNAKAAPCPMLIDKPGTKSSSVTMRTKDPARIWIIDALKRGYGVACGWERNPQLRTISATRLSIQHRRTMDEWHKRRAAGGTDDDDSDPIPF